MKQYAVTIGYEDYVVSGPDALALMQIAERARLLDRNGKWSEKRRYADDQQPFVTGAVLVEIEQTSNPEPEADTFTAATRAMAGRAP